MRRYVRIMASISAGMRRNQIMPSNPAYTANTSTAVTPASSTKLARMPSFNPASSFCPYLMENTVPLPMARPSRMDVKKVISVNADPTAASAPVPMNRPTMRVSAIL